MPGLLSGRVKVSAGTNYTINNYISLNQAQAGLGFSPTTNTGYTLVIGPDGVATFTNTLGQIAFNSGTITSQSATGDLTLNPSGTGTITLNGPVNIPDGIIGSGFKKEVLVASTANFELIGISTSSIVIDDLKLNYLDRVLLKAQNNPAENGIYYISTATFNGTLTETVLLSRSTDADNTRKLNHVVVPVIGGTSKDRLFYTLFNTTGIVGTDPVVWEEIVDNASTQTIINKGLEFTTIGIINPTLAQFTVLTATNIVRFTDGTESTGTDNGAFVVTGGVGIKKNLWIGGSTNVAGSLNVLSAANLNPAGANVTIKPTGAGTVEILPSTVGTLDNVNIGLTTPAVGNFTLLTSQDQLHVFSTLSTTSTQTGAVVVDGGVGIAGDLVLGGQLIFSGAADTFKVNNFEAAGQVLFTTSTNSTSTTTGALVVQGGVGIAQDLVLGGNLVFTGEAGKLRVATLEVTSTTNAVSTDTGAVTIAGGLGVAKDLVLGGRLYFTGDAGELSVSTLNVTSSTNSFSTDTGALRVVGGVGVGGDLHLGGSLFFENAAGSLNAQSIHVLSTETSTSTSSGALIVDGGVGIGKDVYIGGNLDLSGQLTFNKSFTATFVALHITSTQSSTSIFDENAVYVEGGVAVKKDLSVYGNTLIAGNLTVQGTQTNVESTSTYVVDPIFDIGTGPNNTALTTNDGFDRGLLLHYNTGATVNTNNHAFVGRDATTGYFTYKVNIFPGPSEGFPANFTNTGTYGTAQFGGLRLSGGSQSISTNTGDLQVLGGIGVNRNSYFGAELRLGSTAANSTQTLNHALVIPTGGVGVGGDSYFAGVVKFANSAATSSPTTGGVVITGGLGLGGGATIAGPVRITNGTASISTETGALTIEGGVGIKGDLHVRNVFTENGTLFQFDGGTISQPLAQINTAQSYSTATGAVVITGGTGIGKDLWVGGTGNFGNVFVNGAQVLTTATPTGFNGGTIIYPLVIGYSTSTLNTTGLTVNSEINSYSTLSGAIVTMGGVGIGKDVHIGGTLFREGDLAIDTLTDYGVGVHIAPAVFQDDVNTGALTSTQMIYVGQPTFQAPFGASYTTASSVWIENEPIAGTNTTFGGKYAVWVNDGKVHIGSTASSAFNYLDNALSIAGGVGIQGGVQLSGDLNALKVYDSGNRVVSFVDVQAGSGITTTGIAGGPTATVVISNAGVIEAVAGTGINVDQATGVVTITNVGVNEIIPTNGIAVSTGTGTVTISNTGVLSLTAGADIAVTTSTGNITVHNTSTLQTVTARGSTTDRAIYIANTGTEALKVEGGTVLNGTLTVNGQFNAGGSTIVGNTATFTNLTAGDTLITGQLTVAGTATYVNSTQLTVVDPVIDVGTGINNAPLLVNDGFDRGVLIHYNTTNSSSIAYDAHAFLGRDNATGKLTYRTNIWPGGVTDVPNPFSSTGTLGTAVFAGLELKGGIASTGATSGDLQVAGGVGIGGNSVFDARLKIADPTQAISSQTGALQVVGGIGVGKNVYVEGDVIVRGYVLTTATAYNGGEVFGAVIISNSTPSTSTLTGALIVHDGGAGIGGDVWVGGVVNAQDFYVNGNPITTAIHLDLGRGLEGSVSTASNGVTIALTNTGILSLDAGTGISIWNTATSGVTTITNIGVTSLTSVGAGFGISASTGSVVVANLGVTSAIGGTGIRVNQSTGTVTFTNVGVTSIGKIGSGLTVTTSTGSVFLINSGVTSLTAGTDTAISSLTGDITVWNTSTLQTVTDRGNITTNVIAINNADDAANTQSGALQVAGGVGIAKKLYVGGTIVGLNGYEGLNPPAIYVNTSSVTVYDNGGGSIHQVDVVISNNTVTQFKSNGINITTTINSTSTNTGALTVAGGIGVNKDVYVGGIVTGLNNQVTVTNLSATNKIYSANGYVGLNPWTIFTGTSNVTVVDAGSGLREIDVVVSGTNVATFYNNGVSVLTTLNATDVVSTGTITRSGNISKAYWGTSGAGLNVASATYSDTTSVGTVPGAHINTFNTPIIGSSAAVQYTNVSTVYIGGAPTAGGAATLANSWSMYVNSGKVKIADTSVSNSTQTGALQVVGGVGVGGNINVDGYIDINGTTMFLGNSETQTYTSPAISSNSTVNLDTFSVDSYQSAKYFVQVVDNTAVGQPNKMYITELIVYHDGNGLTYINEYGMSSNFGDLGAFDATISSGNVQLTFTPNYVPTSMVVKVHRLTLSR